MRKLFLVLALAVPGCVSDATRQLNRQNYQAGTLIAERSNEPEIKQAGVDISQNSAEIALDIGLPKDRNLAYSPQASAAVRDEAKASRETAGGILGIAKGVIGSTPWGAGILGLVTTGLALWSKSRTVGNLENRLSSVYHGVEHVRNVVKNVKDGERVSEDDVVNILRRAAEVGGTYQDIKADLKNLKIKGSL